jgi:hypothetical protein
MEHRFFRMVLNLTIGLAFFCFLILGLYQNFLLATGILWGAGWGLLNLYFLKKMLLEWLKLQGRNRLRLFFILQVKFPFLYLIGYGLLKLKLFSPFIFLMGFNLIFLAIFIITLQAGYVFFHAGKKTVNSPNLRH